MAAGSRQPASAYLSDRQPIAIKALSMHACVDQAFTFPPGALCRQPRAVEAWLAAGSAARFGCLAAWQRDAGIRGGARGIGRLGALSIVATRGHAGECL